MTPFSSRFSAADMDVGAATQYGPEAARNVQRFMEYDPAPPYAEVPANV